MLNHRLYANVVEIMKDQSKFSQFHVAFRVEEFLEIGQKRISFENFVSSVFLGTTKNTFFFVNFYFKIFKNVCLDEENMHGCWKVKFVEDALKCDEVIEWEWRRNSEREREQVRYE